MQRTWHRSCILKYQYQHFQARLPGGFWDDFDFWYPSNFQCFIHNLTDELLLKVWLTKQFLLQK